MFYLGTILLLGLAVLGVVLRLLGVKHYCAIPGGVFLLVCAVVYFGADYFIRSRPYP